MSAIQSTVRLSLLLETINNLSKDLTIFNCNELNKWLSLPASYLGYAYTHTLR
jgi:hypothetical protein